VRLSTDSVFGWREGPESSGIETLLLTTESWLHWLLLNITSAIIVARALKPQRKLVFAHDCAVDDKLLVVKVRNLRWKHTGSVMSNVRVSMCAKDMNGVSYPVEVKEPHMPLWTSMAASLPIQHKIDDPSSPFHPEHEMGGVDRVMNVSVHVEAEDRDGNRVSASAIYFNPEGGRTSYLLDKGHHIPRIIWGGKFAGTCRGEPSEWQGESARGRQLATRTARTIRS
jgi:hypothetical protein